jgi:nucleoside-diphosphate-sugar epimerase
MQKILVTGGAGYIGSILVPDLLNNGYEVTVLDLFNRPDIPLAHICENPHFNVIRGDARDTELIHSIIKNFDIIIPLAAMVGAPICSRDKLGAISTNYDAVKLLLSNMSSEQLIVYPTTNSGYGIGEKGKFCDETTPLSPISLYGKTKVDAEKAVLDSGKGISLRLATVFGISPKMRIDLLVNDFTWRACVDKAVVIFEGDFKRNYIHVRDVSKAFNHAILNADNFMGQAYNVGLSSANLTKLELCQKIKEQIPGFVFLESPIGEDPDKRDYMVSNDKIEATGFIAEWTIEKGISELVKGYKMLNVKRYVNV